MRACFSGKGYVYKDLLFATTNGDGSHTDDGTYSGSPSTRNARVGSTDFQNTPLGYRFCGLLRILQLFVLPSTLYKRTRNNYTSINAQFKQITSAYLSKIKCA